MYFYLSFEENVTVRTVFTETHKCHGSRDHFFTFEKQTHTKTI